MTTLAATLDVLFAGRYIIAAAVVFLAAAFWWERGQKRLDALIAAGLAEEAETEARNRAHEGNTGARWHG